MTVDFNKEVVNKIIIQFLFKLIQGVKNDKKN